MPEDWQKKEFGFFMTRRQRIAFGETELGFVQKMARPLANREKLIAKRENPFTKHLVATGRHFGNVIEQQVRRDRETGHLHLYYIRYDHIHPEYVRPITAIPPSFRELS